jgi:hypothetical protein
LPWYRSPNFVNYLISLERSLATKLKAYFGDGGIWRDTGK